MPLRHYFNAVLNPSTGAAIEGARVRLFDSSDDSLVTIYGDASSTPIETVSGVENAAVTDSDGMFSLYVDNGTYTIRFYGEDDDTVLKTIENVEISVEATYAALAETTGAALVGFTQAEDATARTVEAKLRDTLHAKDFGAVGDGVTDDTAALVALFAEMQATGNPGSVGSEGADTRYLIDCGALEWTFDNSPSVDSPGPAGPVLLTCGKVTLVAKEGSADAAFISIHNDPLAGSRYVHGGYVGALNFEDTTADTATNRHGIELYGVEAMKFGPMFSENLQGDLVHVKEMGNVLTGDAWHVSQCTFESLTAWPGVDGWALNNDALSQFMNFCHIGMIWRVANPTKPGLGAWRGAGAANVCERMSVLGTTGWAVDWSVAGSSTQVATITNCHLDGPEYGIWIDGPQLVRLGAVRIVHRYMESGIQDDDTAGWPKTVLKVGGNGLSTQDLEARFYNYFKEGFSTTNPGLPVGHNINDKIGDLTDLGSDSSIRDIKVKHRLGYINPGIAVPSTNYIVNHNASATGCEVIVSGKQYLKNSNTTALVARIASGNWPTGYGYASRLDFSSVEYDKGGDYSVANKYFTAPAAGRYKVNVQLMGSDAAGALVRIGLIKNGSATPTREAHYRAQGGGAQTFTLNTEMDLVAGDTLAVIASSAAGPAFGSGSTAVVYCNRFEVALAS